MMQDWQQCSLSNVVDPVLALGEHSRQRNSDCPDVQHEEEPIQYARHDTPLLGHIVGHLPVLESPYVRLDDPPDLADVGLQSASVLDRLRAPFDRGDERRGRRVLAAAVGQASAAAGCRRCPGAVRLPEVDDRRLDRPRRDGRRVRVGDGGGSRAGAGRGRRRFLVALVVGRPRLSTRRRTAIGRRTAVEMRCRGRRSSDSWRSADRCGRVCGRWVEKFSHAQCSSQTCNHHLTTQQSPIRIPKVPVEISIFLLSLSYVNRSTNPSHS